MSEYVLGPHEASLVKYSHNVTILQN